MKGYGLTVFKGTEPERFDVEVVGVLRNFRPGQEPELMMRSFDIDVKSCVRCGGRLQVRAVVTDPESARKILDALPPAARAPPPRTDSVVVDPLAFA